MLRRCTKCQRELPATTIYFHSAGQGGRLRGDCKSCVAERAAKEYQLHRTDRDAKTREWVKNNPEGRRAISARYRQKNPEKCRASLKRWEQRNPERTRALAREKTRRWYLRHLDRARAIRRAAVKKRRALKRGAGISKLTRQEWEAIKVLYNHCCAYCETPSLKLTQDHVIPLAKGGDHAAYNVVPACMTCNCSKKAGPPKVPIEKLKFLPHSTTAINPSAVGPSFPL